MPELPEVETSRRAIERLLKGKRIVAVAVDASDRIFFDRDEPEAIRVALEGARVLGSGRKGKYFWLELDRRPWPVFHLGMTGHVQLRKRGAHAFAQVWGPSEGGRRVSAHSGRAQAPPGILPYCRILMETADGSGAAITDPRRFGRMRLARDPLTEPPVSELGFDPLLDFPRARELAAILARRRAPIKAVLLDQGLFAGVGNWIADEVLFQARLSPLRPASELGPAEVARLRAKLLSIVRKSVDVRADYDRYPRTWLFHHRWGRIAGSTTSGKHAIRHDTVGGRTTAWVPTLQK